MKKFQVTRAWPGVEVGQVIELDRIHPSLAAHVVAVRDEGEGDEAKAVGIVDEARAEAGRILAEANLQATEIVNGAYVKAEEVMTKANQVAEDKAKAALAPATPPTPPPVEPPTEPTKGKEAKKAAA